MELDLGFSLYWVNGFQITTEEDVVVLYHSISIISCCCIHITVFKNQSPSSPHLNPRKSLSVAADTKSRVGGVGGRST